MPTRYILYNSVYTVLDKDLANVPLAYPQWISVVTSGILGFEFVVDTISNVMVVIDVLCTSRDLLITWFSLMYDILCS